MIGVLEGERKEGEEGTHNQAHSHTYMIERMTNIGVGGKTLLIDLMEHKLSVN